jgi:ribonuclease HI
MIVTINTDASFSRANKVGSYAFWIVCDLFIIKRHGMLKGRVERPEDAEFKCIINALHTLLKREQSLLATKIIFNTDCLNVIHVMKKSKKEIKLYKLDKWGYPLKEKFCNMLSKKMRKVQLDFRHVKSHVEIKDKRSYVNDWCDQKAKEEMSKWLEQNKNLANK